MHPVNHEGGCLSELALDEWAARELDPHERERVTQHVATCSRCRARHDALERERAEFLAEAPTFADHSRVAGKTRRPRHSELRARPKQRALLGASSLVTLAAAAMLVVWADNSIEQTRSKGAPHVGWFVKRGEHVRRGIAGEALHPGDSLRFVYNSEAPRYLALFNSDARSATVYYPNGPTAVLARPGNDVALDFSVELDEQLGNERVYALFCDAAFPVEPLRAALADTGKLPERPGCDHDVVELHKVAPR